MPKLPPPPRRPQGTSPDPVLPRTDAGLALLILGAGLAVGAWWGRALWGDPIIIEARAGLGAIVIDSVDAGE